MNVTSPSLAASLAKTLTPLSDPLAKTDASKSASSPASSSGSSKETSSPGQDVAEKLKDMSKALIALTLIQDPVERAKAAAHLYKQYSQVAKDYASATAGGREAADLANAQNLAQATDPNAAAQANDPQAADPQAVQATPDGTPVDAAPVADPQAATPQDPASQAAAAQGATPAATPMIMTGAKPRFVADLYMEEIKTFAGAAKQMYDTAVQEAKLKKLTDKSHKDGAADEVEDAKKDLTEAAKAVEGPDATADVQLPSGASSSSPSASILNIKA
ncbi:hypothetical protein [Caulobacter soli]|uniref:hypothetical protein n=1 Tax=Caulobacter soli TaxID=2708539 RepID=UPI0013EBDD7F|nr:hypothetical protein [Caulobacter soli]